MTAAAIQLRDARAATTQEAGLVLAWSKRRPAWTRTDSARWLNERSEPLLAWLRRRAGRAPAHSRQMGYWLKDERPDLFNAAHSRLTAVKPTQRETLLIDEVMP